MIIETKYEIGDKVFVLLFERSKTQMPIDRPSERVPIEIEITGFTIRKIRSENMVFATARVQGRTTGRQRYVMVPEHRIFGSIGEAEIYKIENS